MSRPGLPERDRCRHLLACGRRCLNTRVTGDGLCLVHRRHLWLLPTHDHAGPARASQEASPPYTASLELVAP